MGTGGCRFPATRPHAGRHRTVRIGRFAELTATAVVAGYRDQQKRQLLAEGSGRSDLIDALLEGRAFDDWSLRDVAGQLRLPINGPFVVIAAQVPSVGR